MWERAGRLIVLASMALGIAAHLWLARWQQTLAPAALAAFAVTFAVARVSVGASLALVAGTAYVAPALLSILFGGTDYHHLIVWLAAAAGPVMARGSWSRWHLPRPWLIPLAAWALVIAASWPVVAGREVDFSMSAVLTMNSVQGIFAAPPPVAAAFVVMFAMTQLVGILWIDLLFGAFPVAPLRGLIRYAVVPFIISISASSAVALYQRFIDITWLNPSIWATATRATGLLLDANTFGTGAAIWGPVVLAASWAANRHAGSSAAVFALLFAAMAVSGSRTALAVFSVGTCGVAIAALRRRGLWQPRIGRIAVLIAIGLFVLAAAVIPRDYQSANAFGRLFARVPRLETAELKRFGNELWNRFDYGTAASQIIREHPLTGIGVGAFHVLAPDYIHRSSGGERRVGSDNAQNWWRHQVAELGALGAFPSIAVSLLLMRTLLRRGAPEENDGVSTVLRAVLAGVGIASLVGVPTQHPATFLSVATLFVLLVQWIRRPAAPGAVAPTTTPRIRWAAAFAVAAMVLIGQASSARGELRVPHRAKTFGLPHHYGFSDVEGLSVDGEMRWMRSRALQVVRVEAPWYRLTFWHPRPQTNAPATVSILIDGTPVLQRQIRGGDPSTFFVQAPARRTWMMVEFHVDPDAGAYSAGLAAQWVRHLPPSIPPEQVVR